MFKKYYLFKKTKDHNKECYEMKIFRMSVLKSFEALISSIFTFLVKSTLQVTYSNKPYNNIYIAEMLSNVT